MDELAKKLFELLEYHRDEIRRINIVARTLKIHDEIFKLRDESNLKNKSKQRLLQEEYRIMGKCTCGAELDGNYKSCKKCRKRSLDYYYRTKASNKHIG